MAACVWVLTRPGMMIPPAASMRRTTDQSGESPPSGQRPECGRRPRPPPRPRSACQRHPWSDTMPFEIKRSADDRGHRRCAPPRNVTGSPLWARSHRATAMMSSTVAGTRCIRIADVGDGRKTQNPHAGVLGGNDLLDGRKPDGVRTDNFEVAHLGRGFQRRSLQAGVNTGLKTDLRRAARRRRPAAAGAGRRHGSCRETARPSFPRWARRADWRPSG